MKAVLVLVMVVLVLMVVVCDNIVTIKSFLPPTHGNALLRWWVVAHWWVSVTTGRQPKRNTKVCAGEAFY